VLSYDDFVISLLLEEDVLSPESVEQARAHASSKSISLSDALVNLELVTERRLTLARGSVCECPYVDLSHFEIDLANAMLLPRSVARKFDAFPLFVMDGAATVGMVDPMNLRAVDRLRSLLKTDIEPVICEAPALRTLIERAYSLVGAHATFADHDEREADDEISSAERSGRDEEPIVAAMNQIIAEAITAGASDIHVGPDEHELHVRYRVDGRLRCVQGPPISSHAGLVQRVKVMSHLDLTQTRRPHDGKFRFVHNGRAVDIRVSIIPTIWGENIVMRLLGNGMQICGFAELGCSPETSAALEQSAKQPYGMVLVTGPTGSGKTTTLYTALQLINTPDRNIVTIEDPVEYRLPMVRHVQVNGEIGLSFSNALKSILRQDPDVILLGEIRDEETARIAVQSALTGHLVLSTLHTNDAPGAIARLRDLDVPAFAINASVLCVLAQRLAKRTCEHCIEPYTPIDALLHRFLKPDEKHEFRRGRGCPKCSSVGTKGRIGLHEILTMTPTLQEVIEESGSIAKIRTTALNEGMKPMWIDGVEKAKLGIVTLEEVARVAAGSLEQGESQNAGRDAA
jgi:type IV pilus assembly protein PilB